MYIIVVLLSLDASSITTHGPVPPEHRRPCLCWPRQCSGLVVGTKTAKSDNARPRWCYRVAFHRRSGESVLTTAATRREYSGSPRLVSLPPCVQKQSHGGDRHSEGACPCVRRRRRRQRRWRRWRRRTGPHSPTWGTFAAGSRPAGMMNPSPPGR